MTYDEFKRQLGKAGLTTRELAVLIKSNPNSVTNYARTGHVPSHLAVIAALLGEMAEKQLDFRGVLCSLEIEPKRPRGGAAKGRFGGSPQAQLPIHLDD